MLQTDPARIKTSQPLPLQGCCKAVAQRQLLPFLLLKLIVVCGPAIAVANAATIAIAAATTTVAAAAIVLILVAAVIVAVSVIVIVVIVVLAIAVAVAATHYLIVVFFSSLSLSVVCCCIVSTSVTSLMPPPTLMVDCFFLFKAQWHRRLLPSPSAAMAGLPLSLLLLPSFPSPPYLCIAIALPPNAPLATQASHAFSDCH
jgi:hypothetical protein